MLQSGTDARPDGNKDNHNPDKLRKACNACNAAKVRCSGDRSSCSRCRSAQLNCVYETSRVGKVPGIRKKRRGSQHLAASGRNSDPRTPSHGDFDPVRGHHSAQTGQQFYGAFAPGEWNQQLGEYGSLSPDDIQDIFDTPFQLEEPPVRQQPMHGNAGHNRAISSTATESVAPTFDFEFSVPESQSSASTATMNVPKISRPVPTLATSHSAAQESSGTRTSNDPNLESQCVFACCTIVSNLETFIDARCKVLDLSLDVIRKAIMSLTQIVDAGAGGRCCHMLLGGIMFQLATILEIGCASFLEESSSSKRPNPGGLAQFDSVGGMMSGFGFGGFQVDPGEQRAWRARVVVKEIRQVREVLKRVTALATNDGTVPAGESACHGDVEEKLDALSSKFEKVANS